MKEVIGISLIGIVGMICIALWHKKINPATTWIYAIHCMFILTLISLYSLCTLMN